MSWEAHWYNCVAAAGRYGKRPAVRRLSLQPDDFRYYAAVEIAADFVVDLAGHRCVSGHRSEQYWFWRGEWWRVPKWTINRVLLLINAAETCEIRRCGRAVSFAVAARLRQWGRSGHWRRVVARGGANVCDSKTRLLMREQAERRAAAAKPKRKRGRPRKNEL